MDGAVGLIGRKWRRATTRVDLDSPWRAARFCVVDVETTGLDLQRDEIVSIGHVIIEHGRISAGANEYTVVRSGRPSSVAAIQIHGLRTRDVTVGADPADVARAIASAMHGSILVAHAAWIEQAFLARLLAEQRLRLRAPLVDTAALARAVGLAPRDTGHEPGLEQLAIRLELPVHTPHHALGDAMTTATVFLALIRRVARHTGESAVTVRHLIDLSRKNSLS